MDVTMHWLRGPQSHFIYGLATEFQFSSFENSWNLFSLFIMHIHFFESLSHENNDPTPPNRCSFMGPTWFGWWIMKTKWYHSVFIPSKQALNVPKPIDFLFYFLISTSSILYFVATYRGCLGCYLPYFLFIQKTIGKSIIQWCLIKLGPQFAHMNRLYPIKQMVILAMGLKVFFNLHHLLLPMMGPEHIDRLVLTTAMDPFSPYWDHIMGLLSLWRWKRWKPY